MMLPNGESLYGYIALAVSEMKAAVLSIFLELNSL